MESSNQTNSRTLAAPPITPLSITSSEELIEFFTFTKLDCKTYNLPLLQKICQVTRKKPKTVLINKTYTKILSNNTFSQSKQK